MMAHLCRIFCNKFILRYSKKLISDFTYSKSINYKSRSCSTYKNIDKIKIENFYRNIEDEYKTLSESHDIDSEKRLNELSPILGMLKERKLMLDHIDSLKPLLKENDEEMRKLAEDEKCQYEEKLSHLEEELLDTVLSSDEEDLCDSIVLEVNAGVGGQEAMLFAREIVDMYLKFIEFKNWTCQLAEFDTTDIGGLRHASVFVKGEGVYRYFRYEAGVHRVQRIPTTEKAGRVHTSTISVVALPQPKDIDVNIQEKDLRIDTKRASGAGGQHVNTTDSAVRIVHLPTGITVECQVERSQIKNRELAMKRLKAKLYERQQNQQTADAAATRKSQVRSNFRNEKIRTYNFSQDRITDHRLQSSNLHNLKGFLAGGEQLESLIDKLHEAEKYEKLMKMLNKECE